MEISHETEKELYNNSVNDLLSDIQLSIKEGLFAQENKKLQLSLDHLASKYQNNEEIGPLRYKLYFAQAVIYYQQEDDPQALRFIDEAVNIRGSDFSDAKKLRDLISNQSTENQMPTSAENKIGGWLAYFMFGLFISLGFAIYNSFTVWKLLAGGLTAYTGQYTIDALLFSITSLAIIIALVLLFKKKFYAKYFVIGCILLIVLAYGVDYGINASVYKYINQTAPTNSADSLDRAIVYGIVWILYFSISKRVKQTLVS